MPVTPRAVVSFTATIIAGSLVKISGIIHWLLMKETNPSHSLLVSESHTTLFCISTVVLGSGTKTRNAGNIQRQAKHQWGGKQSKSFRLITFHFNLDFFFRNVCSSAKGLPGWNVDCASLHRHWLACSIFPAFSTFSSVSAIFWFLIQFGTCCIFSARFFEFLLANLALSLFSSE